MPARRDGAMLVGMRKYRIWFIASVLFLLLLVAMSLPRVSAFQYVHHWRVNFSGSLFVSGNQSLPVSPFWSYIGNTSWQTCEQKFFAMTQNNETIEATGIGIDDDGNPRLSLNLTSPLAPQDVLIWEEEWMFTVLDHRSLLPQISVTQSGSLVEVEERIGSEDFDLFTHRTPLWDTTNTSLTDLAQTIRDSLPEERQDNVLALIYASIQWIQANIFRSSGITDPQYPEELIISQIGDCDDQSNLLICLLRIFGIPSYLMTGHWFQEGARTYGFVWGSVANNSYRYVDFQNAVGHGWAMVFVPPWGWLPFDLLSVGIGVNPANTYTDSLYASDRPFVSLWQIVASDYIGEMRTEQTNLFTYQLHRTEYEEWTSLGSVPIIDAEYLAANMVTLIALIITLGSLTFLVGLAIRRHSKEDPNRDSTAPTQ